MAGWGRWEGGLLALALCSCSEPPRPQILLVVDTDAPVISQLAGDDTLTWDAAVDTLRVDVVSTQLKTLDFQVFALPEVDQWPASMGIRGEGSGEARVLVRLRLFRSSLGSTGTTNGVPSLEPPSTASIDRLVELELPEVGVARRRVLLSADCMGAQPSFVPPRITCVDGARRGAAADAGVDTQDSEIQAATRLGSWSAAHESGCEQPAPAGRVCVRGGFTLLGELALAGFANTGATEAVPLRPVALSPFAMDLTEFTVGRLRQLVLDGSFPSDLLPTKPDPSASIHRHCTWLGEGDATNDALPVNCLTWEGAAKACQLVGGALPSEAQWEHAARGRRSYQFPWGDTDPACCTASHARDDGDPDIDTCSGYGVEPAGSHASPSNCSQGADVSRDGVFDLGGSMSEATRDAFRPLSDPCWQHRGVELNPVCADELATSYVSRGGSWAAGALFMLSGARQLFNARGSEDGFRCVYPEGAP